jgi:hypothetical protein
MILADFGLVGNTEKKIRPIFSNFWGQFFHVFSRDIPDQTYSCVHISSDEVFSHMKAFGLFNKMKQNIQNGRLKNGHFLQLR